jgi:hypothetical protein
LTELEVSLVLKRFLVLAVLPLLGCASSGGEADLLGVPQIRTVTAGSGSTGGGEVTRGMAIRYVDEPVLVEDLVGGTREEVLPLLLDAYRAEGLTPDGMDPESGIVSVSRAEWSRERNGLPLSTFLDCGPSSTGRLLADDAQIVSAIATQVRGEGAGVSRVTVRLDAQAFPLSNLGGRARGCTTTGVLERAILAHIQTALAPEQGESGVQEGGIGPQPSLSNPVFRVDVTDLPFEPGDKVRVWLSESERLSGAFLGFHLDTLLLRTSRRTTVPIRSIQALQVKRIRRLPVLVGALVGIATGVTVAMTTGLGIGGRHAVQGEILNPGLGAVFGGTIGAGVGYLSFGRSWLDVPLEKLWPGPRPDQ